MYRILIPVDDDEDRARRQAEFVADMPLAGDDVEVTVAHALSEAAREAPTSMQSPDRVATVRQVLEVLEDTDVTVEVGDIGQPPVESILLVADEIDADLIVLGGRKQSPAGKVLFGSVTQEVLLETDRTVAVTGGGD